MRYKLTEEKKYEIEVKNKKKKQTWIKIKRAQEPRRQNSKQIMFEMAVKLLLDDILFERRVYCMSNVATIPSTNVVVDDDDDDGGDDGV